MQACHGAVPVDQVTWLYDRPLDIAKAKAALSEGANITIAGQQRALIFLKTLSLVGIDRLGPSYLYSPYLDVQVHQIQRTVLGMPQWKMLGKVVYSTSTCIFLATKEDMDS